MEERREFEEGQKAKSLFRYGLGCERWGSKVEAQRWLEHHLRSRDFKKLEDTWVTKQQYFDYQQRQKGLYKYIEAGLEKWASIDEILDGLSPRKFEDFIGLLFKSTGYEVTNLPYIGDYGADLLVKKSGKTISIQAKKYGLGRKVGAPEVQKTLGAMWKYKADKSMLITTGQFTSNAYEQAHNAPIKLWDREKLKEVLRQHLPSNLIRENPFLFRNRHQLNRCVETYKSVVSKAVSQANPQTAVRIKFELKKTNHSLDVSISAPLEGFPLLEKAAEELIQTLSVELERAFRAWLNQLAKAELKKLLATYPFFQSRKNKKAIE